MVTMGVRNALRFAVLVRICVTFKVRVKVRVKVKCWGWYSDNYRHSASCELNTICHVEKSTFTSK